MSQWHSRGLDGLNVWCVVDGRRGRGRMLWMAAALLLSLAGGRLVTARPVDVPVINAGLGPCTADFTVTDSDNKPVYNSKIHVTIKYGALGKRSQDLDIGTNSDGKARFEGLPEKLKKPPMEFKITSGDMSKTVPHDPATDCHPNFSVTLGKP